MQKVSGIAGHPVGTMYVADNYNGLIRMISADGSSVSTLVGTAGGAMPRSDANTNPFGFLSTLRASSAYVIQSIARMQMVQLPQWCWHLRCCRRSLA
jgi:hypothetical protein